MNCPKCGKHTLIDYCDACKCCLCKDCFPSHPDNEGEMTVEKKLEDIKEHSCNISIGTRDGMVLVEMLKSDWDILENNYNWLCKELKKKKRGKD